MRAPRWFHDAVSRARTAIDTGRPADELTSDLAARILGDEAFTIAIITEYTARRIATQHPHTKRGRWTDPTKRMTRAAELRDAGLSVRKIAARLVVSVGTVHKDLSRWDAARATVTTLPFKTGVHHASTNSDNAREMNGGTEHATITTLRRNR